jgi:hypothetical protein
MRGLIGDRLLKRLTGEIWHQPGFGLPGVLSARSDSGAETMKLPEMTEEEAQARPLDRGGEATDKATSETGAKPTVNENAGLSQVWEESMNSNADKLGKQETN